VIGQFSLNRMNRIASIAILPMMVLAIVVFGRFADDGAVSDEPAPESGLLVVANLREESLAFIDLRTQHVRTLRLPGPPHEMVEAGGRLYVTLGRANQLVEVEPSSGAILRVLPLEGEPHGIAAYGDSLAVTLDKADALVVLDRASLSELRRFPTGQTPHTVAVSAGAIVVTDSRDNALRQVEPTEVVVPSGAMPESIAIVGGHAVSADAHSGSITIARLPGLDGARAVALGSAPVRVIPFDAESVLVSLQGEGEVAHVSLPSGKVTKRMNVADRPDGLCLTEESPYFAVASNGEGAVELFSTVDWKSVPRLNLQPGLGACLWLPAR
jgi:hypothetical protein